MLPEQIVKIRKMLFVAGQQVKTQLDYLMAEIEERDLEVVVIQYNFSFFSLACFQKWSETPSRHRKTNTFVFTLNRRRHASGT